eukprot:6732838-Prymnesium_polylepis.2
MTVGAQPAAADPRRAAKPMPRWRVACRSLVCMLPRRRAGVTAVDARPGEGSDEPNAERTPTCAASIPSSKPQPRTHASLTKVDAHTPEQHKRCGLASAWQPRVERGTMRDARML